MIDYGMKTASQEMYAHIPMQFIGPIHIIAQDEEYTSTVPLATYESPLWPSTHRGARIALKSGGLRITVMDERMTRSVAVQAPNAARALQIKNELLQRIDDLQSITRESSRFATLLTINSQFVGDLLFLRLEFDTGDAAGHNMVTKASEYILNWILDQFPDLTYVSISGNFCTDKKNSSVNGILGRGKNVIAEALIPVKVCKRYLKQTPEKIIDLNIKKNLIGSIIAGSVRSANAHFANMLLAFFLATGQDAANIVEGSQGFVHAEKRGPDLYFSVTCPNLIVGSVGSGKNLEFVKKNLEHLGCTLNRSPGENARRLATFAAAVVWCGELSLLAAQTNPGELMRAHESMERL